MNKKIISYALLTAFFLLAAVLLQTAMRTVANAPDESAITLPEITESFLAAPLFRMVFTLYFILFIWGLCWGIFWIIRRVNKKPVFPASGGSIALPYDDGYNAKIVTLASAGIFFSSLVMFLFAYVRPDANWPRATIFYNIFLEIFTLLILMRYIRLSQLGVRKTPVLIYATLGLYAASIWLLFPAAFINHAVVSKFGIKSSLNPAIPLFFMLENDSTQYLLLFQIVILGPVVEELFFRGFLFGWLRKKMPFVLAALCVSALFSVIHRTHNVVLPLFILSFLLCFLYERTHNMANSILFHSFHNFMGCLVLFGLKQATEISHYSFM